jgi:hypothetical protein
MKNRNIQSKTTARLLIPLLLACFAAMLAGLPASAAPMTTVSVVGEATGFLPAPCNCTAGIVIAINVRGSAGSLQGAGTNHATTGVTNRFQLTGSITGPIVLLSGTIIRSTTPAIEGSPIEIEADATTGAMRVTLGPLAGGVFAGQTLVFEGSATVLITGGN